MTLMDDVIARVNYDAARDIFFSLAEELVDEVLAFPSTPKAEDLALRVQEAKRVVESTRRALLIEMQG